jgi:DNA-binding NarL/FixJ family response regulator
MSQIPVFVFAADPLTQAGIASVLRTRPEVRIVGDGDVDNAEVAIVAADHVDEDIARVIRAIQRNGCPRVVLVLTRLDEASLLVGVQAGACGFVRRTHVDSAQLVEAIRAAAAGEGSVPPDMLGALLAQLSHLHDQVLEPHGLALSGLAERELDVLRLVAEGLDTAEIARELSYSERTVKGVIHDVTTRLQLKNRSHAVAYALRRGLI